MKYSKKEFADAITTGDIEVAIKPGRIELEDTVTGDIYERYFESDLMLILAEHVRKHGATVYNILDKQ